MTTAFCMAHRAAAAPSGTGCGNGGGRRPDALASDMLAPDSRGPIDALDALERVEAELLALLAGVTPDEWNAPTIVRGWHVRHVVGHLLDTATRKLALVRDGFGVEQPASGAPEDVRAFVDRLNAEGVRVYGRLSCDVSRLLLSHVSPAFCAWHRALDPMAPAAFAVSWAGEAQSPNWFDTARELTERWHHQAQIRLALDRPALDAREVYHPVLDCFMRVLPYAYRHVSAPPGTLVSIRVDGHAADDWQLFRGPDRWLLSGGLTTIPTTVVGIPGDIAWRVFTKGIDRVELERRVAIAGDPSLAQHALTAVAIVG